MEPALIFCRKPLQMDFSLASNQCLLRFGTALDMCLVANKTKDKARWKHLVFFVAIDRKSNIFYNKDGEQNYE